MLNENNFSTRLPNGSPRLGSQIKFFFRLLGASPEKSEIVPGQNFFVKKMAYGLCLLVVFLLAGGVYAYSSPTVTAGDSLFAVKQLGEKAILFAASANDQSQIWVKIANRRLSEFNYLTGGNIDDKFSLIKSVQAAEEDKGLSNQEKKAALTLEMMKTAFDKGLSLIAQISDSDKAVKAAALLDKFQNKRQAILEASLSNSSEAELAAKSRIAGGLVKKNRKPLTPEMAEKIALAIDESETRNEAIKKIKEELRRAAAEKRKISAEKIASSSDVFRKQKITKEVVEARLAEIKEDTAVWKATVSEKVGTTTPQVEKLFQRIDDRLAKVEHFLKDEKIEAAAGLLKSVQALQNNAKFLVAGNDWKDKMERAKYDVKINRFFSNQALAAIRERNASSSWEKLRQVGQGVENGQMASTTRQRLQEKIRNFQEQTRLELEKEAKVRLLPKRMIKEGFKNQPKAVGPEINILPNRE